MRFSLSTSTTALKEQGDPGRFINANDTNTSSDFDQWLHAMKMVARLPGGMPPEFRRKLWLALADKYLQSKNIDWEREEIKCFSEQWREDDEELGIQIVKDLHRTGSSLCSGPAGTKNQAKLRRILLGYARFNPEVGYCQGFNMLGALILQVMDKEEIESIKVMIYLVEGILPAGYFSGSLFGLQADMAVFRELMTSKLPRLAKHLQKLQGPVENAFEPPLTNVFTMQWFLTMFCTCLPMTCVLRVWDLVLIEGSGVLLRTALVLWSLLEERILNARTADDFYCKMGSFSSELLNGHLIDSNGLIEKVVELGSIPELQKLRDKHLYNISPFRDKRGLQLYYSDEDGDSDEDSRMAVATAWGLRLSRRGSAGLNHKSDGKDRIALDISLLKKQYDRLRERQRQAHIILTSAVARQSSIPNQSSIQMNQLLTGRNAIITNNGRRLGPPQGAIPPVRKPSLPTTKLSNPAQTTTFRSGETLHWRDTDLSKRRRGSLKWKDIKPDGLQSGQDDRTPQLIESTPSSRSSSSEPKAQRPFLKNHQRSDSSSYSEDSDGSSSTSTSLCDEDDNDIGNVSSLEGSPLMKSKSSKKHSEVLHKKCVEDVINCNEKCYSANSQIPFIQLTTIDSPVVNANNTDIDSPQYSKRRSNHANSADFVVDLSWPDTKETSSALLEEMAIGVTSREIDFHSLSNDITCSSQLSPIPDIETYINNSSISPLRTPTSAFDFENLVVSIDDTKKFDVNDEGVTNEYFERINIVERPTKLDLFYSLNEEDSIRNAYTKCQFSPEQVLNKYKELKNEKPFSKSQEFLQNTNSTMSFSSTSEELDRKMKVLLEFSNKSSLSFIAEAKHEISSGMLSDKEFDPKVLKCEPSVNTTLTTDRNIEPSCDVRLIENKDGIVPILVSFENNSSQSYGLDSNLSSKIEDGQNITQKSRKERQFEEQIEPIHYFNMVDKDVYLIDEHKCSDEEINNKTEQAAKETMENIPSTEDLEIRYEALQIKFSDRKESYLDDENTLMYIETKSFQSAVEEETCLQSCTNKLEKPKSDRSPNFKLYEDANHESISSLSDQSDAIPTLSLDNNIINSPSNNNMNALAEKEQNKKQNPEYNEPNENSIYCFSELSPKKIDTHIDANKCQQFSNQGESIDPPTDNKADSVLGLITLMDSLVNCDNIISPKLENCVVNLSISINNELDITKECGQDDSKIQKLAIEKEKIFCGPSIYSTEIKSEGNDQLFDADKPFSAHELEAGKILKSDKSIVEKDSNICICSIDSLTNNVPILKKSDGTISENILFAGTEAGAAHQERYYSQPKSINTSAEIVPTEFQSLPILQNSNTLEKPADNDVFDSADKLGFEDLNYLKSDDVLISALQKIEEESINIFEMERDSVQEKKLDDSVPSISETKSELFCSKINHPFELKKTITLENKSRKLLQITPTSPEGNEFCLEGMDSIHVWQGKSKIPSTEDLESRFNAIEKQFTENSITLPNQSENESVIKIKEQCMSPVVLKNTESKEVNTKQIPTTADLEHRFKKLERKLIYESMNLPQEGNIQANSSKSSNSLKDLPNNEDMLPPNASDSSALVITTKNAKTEPSFVRKRIPSTEDLEIRFKALEIEKSFKSPTTTTSNALIPSKLLTLISETEDCSKQKFIIPSTKDLENRFKAFEQSKVAKPSEQPHDINNCTSKPGITIPSSNDLQTILPALMESNPYVNKSTRIGKSEPQIFFLDKKEEDYENITGTRLINVNCTKLKDVIGSFSETILVLRSTEDIRDNKNVPSTEDLETRFEALERHKCIADNFYKSTDNRYANNSNITTEERVKTENTNINQKNKHLNQDLETSIEVIVQQKWKRSDSKYSANRITESMEQQSKNIPSTQDLETRFAALEQKKYIEGNNFENQSLKDNMTNSESRFDNLNFNKIHSPSIGMKKNEQYAKTSKDTSTQVSQNRFVGLEKKKSINIDFCESAFIEMNLTDQAKDEQHTRDKCISVSDHLPEREQANGLNEMPDDHKKKHLLKQESQSDATLTVSHPIDTEFERKIVARPKSCPEYYDPFYSNYVTTDRVLKVIEENSMILHRILKKTLADNNINTGTKDQMIKSQSKITDSLLGLGNICPRSSDHTLSPRHIKSNIWIRPPFKRRSEDNISERLASIKSTIKSIDNLCEEKTFRKEKCQHYINSLFACPTISGISSINPSIEINDFEYKSSDDRISMRELKKDISPRRRRTEDREEYESRVRRYMMSNSSDASSDFTFGLEVIEQVDSKVNIIHKEKQIDNQIEQPLSPCYGSDYNNKRTITPVAYIPAKLDIRHTTVTSTFYDRYLTERHIERTFPRNKKSPVSPTITKSYLDISKYSSTNPTDRSSKSAENSPFRRHDGGGSLSNQHILKNSLHDLHIHSCDNILLQLRSHKNDIVPSIMVSNPLSQNITKPIELGTSLNVSRNFYGDESSKS